MVNWKFHWNVYLRFYACMSNKIDGCVLLQEGIHLLVSFVQYFAYHSSKKRPKVGIKCVLQTKKHKQIKTVCTFHLTAPGSSPKHTIYAIFCWIESWRQDENKQKEAGIGSFLSISKPILSIPLLLPLERQNLQKGNSETIFLVSLLRRKKFIPESVIFLCSDFCLVFVSSFSLWFWQFLALKCLSSNLQNPQNKARGK